ncbi:ankyrin repeat domain-containing protein [Candidatus Babeliales bacterium]|nr:ankyrin repeat domain-containing protein [Candidatus Babeliales bacterium]
MAPSLLNCDVLNIVFEYIDYVMPFDKRLSCWFVNNFQFAHKFKTRRGKNLLMIYSSKGNVANVRKLLQNKANINDAYPANGYSALLFANNKNVVKELLKWNPDVNMQCTLNKKTALMNACSSGSHYISKLLLETGKCKINIQDRYGNNAIMYASINGHLSIVKEILKYDPILTLVNRSELNVMSLAYINNNNKMFILLCHSLQKGDNKN